MKIFSLATILLVLFCCGTQTQAQENMTPGIVWRVTMYKVKPGKMNDVLMDMRRNFRVVNEEYKRQGLILDYRVYTNSTTDGPGDWDFAIAIGFKNWAALDDLGPKVEAITLKHYGSREKRQQAGDARNQMREVVASRLMREQTLIPLP